MWFSEKNKVRELDVAGAQRNILKKVDAGVVLQCLTIDFLSFWRSNCSDEP